MIKKALAVLAVIGTFMLSACEEEKTTNRIYVFSQPGCIHCEHARAYMQRYYKNYDIKELNIHEGSNMSYMVRYARRFKVPESSLGTPFIVMGNRYVMGWGGEQIKNFNRYAKSFKPKNTK